MPVDCKPIDSRDGKRVHQCLTTQSHSQQTVGSGPATGRQGRTYFPFHLKLMPLNVSVSGRQWTHIVSCRGWHSVSGNSYHNWHCAMTAIVPPVDSTMTRLECMHWMTLRAFEKSQPGYLLFLNELFYYVPLKIDILSLTWPVMWRANWPSRWWVFPMAANIFLLCSCHLRHDLIHGTRWLI